MKNDNNANSMRRAKIKFEGRVFDASVFAKKGHLRYIVAHLPEINEKDGRRVLVARTEEEIPLNLPPMLRPTLVLNEGGLMDGYFTVCERSDSGRERIDTPIKKWCVDNEFPDDAWKAISDLVIKMLIKGPALEMYIQAPRFMAVED